MDGGGGGGGGDGRDGRDRKTEVVRQAETATETEPANEPASPTTLPVATRNGTSAFDSDTRVTTTGASSPGVLTHVLARRIRHQRTSRRHNNHYYACQFSLHRRRTLFHFFCPLSSCFLLLFPPFFVCFLLRLLLLLISLLLRCLRGLVYTSR